MTLQYKKDRRRHQRLILEPMYTSVTIEREDQDAPAGLIGHVYDISLGGVRVELDEPLQPHETISAEIVLPGEIDPICVRGKIVWVHDSADDPGPRRMAMQFENFLTKNDHHRLRSYLAGCIAVQMA